MSKLQSIVLSAGLVLFCLLYFGFSTKPKAIAGIESKRVVATEITDINNLIRDVQDKLTPDQKSYLITLEKEVEGSENESNRLELLKRLSGKWFEYQQPHIAGFYAEKVAELENTKVNLALCYVEYPLQDNPMKGILMLVDLNKNNPDNSLVLTNLGRLAIQTRQYDKAIERLGRVVELDPKNRNANCLLAQAYGEMGNQEKTDFYLNRCKEN